MAQNIYNIYLVI